MCWRSHNGSEKLVNWKHAHLHLTITFKTGLQFYPGGISGMKQLLTIVDFCLRNIYQSRKCLAILLVCLY